MSQLYLKNTMIEETSQSQLISMGLSEKYNFPNLVDMED